jgi:hypothetical protein
LRGNDEISIDCADEFLGQHTSRREDMGKLKMGLLVFIALALQSCVVVDPDRDVAYCRADRRLQIVDLDMSPDPIGQGQPIDRWFVRLRSEGTTDCRTVIRIRDADGEEVGREVRRRLRPGLNAIEVEPFERYRLSRGEHCFQVIADIEGNWRPVDAARRFCAREMGGRRWTMRS